MHAGFLCTNLKESDDLEDVRRVWEDNIEVDLKKNGCESMNHINVACDRDKWRAVREIS